MTSTDRTRRALISVFDKTGIVELGRALHELGWELISSGGTASVLVDAGVAVTDVAEYTGMPVMFGHRVVTLHHRIHAGILADRGSASHLADLHTHGIEPIDLVVVNFYPFDAAPGIEMIDIGGPTLVRGAAKNHSHVGVVVDPHEYEAVVAEITAQGVLSRSTRQRLARTAFAHTASYDAAIRDWFDADSADGTGVDHVLPRTVQLVFERASVLRYGENPHQAAARYRALGETGMWEKIIQHNGPALSYLNIFDADVAWRIVHDLGSSPSAVIIKHANPCGVAVADDLATATERAYECDPHSAFGGVIATNRVIDQPTADVIVGAAQADVIVAPGYQQDVINRLVTKRRNTRILQLDPASSSHTQRAEVRQIGDGFLLQEPRSLSPDASGWATVTRRQPTDVELVDAVFAWRVCAHTKSNAVVLARNRTTVGIGTGQQNRATAGELAAANAAGRAAGGACASDGFYPFADGIHAAADAGVAVIVQPGGSVNDESTISAADDRGVAMMFTGERQFLH